MAEAPPPPKLVEVRGPTALGGGFRRFFELLWLIAVNDFKKAYFGTVLGYFWSLLRPLALFAVLLFVFTRIFRIGSEVEYYPVLLLFNIVMISFFQEATLGSVASVVNQENLVRKTRFPRLVIPLAVVLTGLFNFGTNLIAVLIFIIAFGVPLTWTWLLFPLIVIALFVFTMAVSMLLSALYVRFRDVGIIWSVLVTAIFYATPVLYPIEIVPSQYVDWIMANPLTPIFEQARHWVIDPGAPGAVSAAGGVTGLLPAALIYVAVCVAAVIVFRREAPRIAEEL
ncbi:MAG: ABC transporter permease [Solirubrobacterales bacterium]|nr:ABC transporter permease [Solirubrobacterales bacterium]MCB8914372.1 ABC transporter permease [Thermoleophilales bacterium]